MNRRTSKIINRAVAKQFADEPDCPAIPSVKRSIKRALNGMDHHERIAEIAKLKEFAES